LRVVNSTPFDTVTQYNSLDDVADGFEIHSTHQESSAIASSEVGTFTRRGSPLSLFPLDGFNSKSFPLLRPLDVSLKTSGKFIYQFVSGYVIMRRDCESFFLLIIASLGFYILNPGLGSHVVHLNLANFCFLRMGFIYTFLGRKLMPWQLFFVGHHCLVLGHITIHGFKEYILSSCQHISKSSLSLLHGSLSWEYLLLVARNVLFFPI